MDEFERIFELMADNRGLAVYVGVGSFLVLILLFMFVRSLFSKPSANKGVNTYAPVFRPDLLPKYLDSLESTGETAKALIENVNNEIREKSEALENIKREIEENGGIPPSKTAANPYGLFFLGLVLGAFIGCGALAAYFYFN